MLTLGRDAHDQNTLESEALRQLERWLGRRGAHHPGSAALSGTVIAATAMNPASKAAKEAIGPCVHERRNVYTDFFFKST